MRAATSAILALCQVALFVGCTDSSDTPAAPSAAEGAPALDRVGSTPITGTCETTYELTELEFQPPPNDALLAHANYHGAGSCQLSHLGAGALVNSGSIDFTVLPALGSGTFTLTAANGDRLDGTEEIDYLIPDANGLFGFTGVRVITGGTGRFAGAHGSLSVSGTGSTEASTTEQFHVGRLVF
jgi:hypothetical protein